MWLVLLEIGDLISCFLGLSKRLVGYLEMGEPIFIYYYVKHYELNH